MSHRLEQAIDTIINAQRTIVLTGAGISTLSGIPDFRSPKTGLWHQYDAEKIFLLEHFLEEPQYFYNFARDTIFKLFYESQPNAVHRLVAQLQHRGYIRRIITQNIDMLHQQAGSVDVLELHGSPATSYCIRCDKMFSFNDMVNRVMAETVPRCDACGGLIKPDIIFFGEMLHEQILSAAYNEAHHADCCLALGTSLQVYPAASIPQVIVQSGGTLILVNREPTPQDSSAKYVFRMELDRFAEQSTALLKELGVEVG